MKTELAKRLRLLASVVSVLVLLAIIGIAWIYLRVRASLPQLDGRATIPGLTTNVTVDRDSLGVPTIRAQDRLDVARALGFLHAQDRFFQMDVWRRAAAGELSAVFGLRTLRVDRQMRMHGFRKLAEESYARLSPDDRAVLQAYADGVNAGLAALKEKPFEYIITGTKPQPWKPEDTFLVSDAMLVDLQDETGRYERTVEVIRDQLGQAGLAFF
ncbi:MAG TPA: penicillin acylase family protein, partial [Opitutaceae bacterium]|nr:penicillin acylase family protein [Opitutaceae bacterium]